MYGIRKQRKLLRSPEAKARLRVLRLQLPQFFAATPPKAPAGQRLRKLNFKVWPLGFRV